MRAVAGLLGLGLMAMPSGLVQGQRAADMSQSVRDVVTHDAPVIAITNVLVVDGTGGDARPGQTVVIEDGRIARMGTAGSVVVDESATIIDGSGHTLIPGLVGMHNHLFYTAVGGRRVHAGFTSPRLYLASGVTTIRTTGSNAGYADVNVKNSIDRGLAPGPKIHITAPYMTGPDHTGYMTAIQDAEAARRFVSYWAAEGATWIKAYTTITPESYAAAIDEAHKHGMKVTGHICSVSHTEAAAMGVDAVEHGLLTNSDFDPERDEPGECPANSMVRIGNTVDLESPLVHEVIDALVSQGVGMTSTTAVIEPFVANRPTAEERTLAAMAPEVRDAYLEIRHRIDSAGSPFTESMLLKSLHFDKMFYDAGGVLGAGVDPTGIGGALAGYGDQRNYELLIEGGFAPVEAMEVMTLHGARILGNEGDIGSVEVGKAADLVLLEGNLVADPSVIRNVTVVFKDGVGYDPAKLIASVEGRVGIN